MKAFILAAGLGSRLVPLTDYKPKALVEFNGRPMLQGVIEQLKKQGFDQFMINIHHFGDLVLDFLKRHDNFGVEINISDERDLLLDTGGAMVKASWFFEGEEPVLVHNVDIVADFDFVQMMELHRDSGALVSLAVRNRTSSRKLLFDESMELTGWKNIKTHEVKWVKEQSGKYQERAYSGIYVASPDFPALIKQEGSFPIIPVWLSLAKLYSIKGVEYDQGFWFDLGSVEKIKEAESKIEK